MSLFSPKTLLSHPVFIPVSLILLAAAALVSVFIAQYIFGLAPCPLCIYQRWPYAMIGLLGVGGVFFGLKKREKAVSLAVFIASLAFLAGGVIAAYHVGVENHFWKSFLEGCTINFDDAGDLLKQIEGTKAARCDEIPWSLFGISMAGYNAIISLLAAPFYALSALLIVRKANGF